MTDYQIALNAFNAAMRADPICRQLASGRRAWGDIMYEEDTRIAKENGCGVSLLDKMIAQQAALPVAAPIVQEYRYFPVSSAPSQPRPHVQRPQMQQQQRPEKRPQTQHPFAPVPVEKKRARNAFTALNDDSDEEE